MYFAAAFQERRRAIFLAVSWENANAMRILGRIILETLKWAIGWGLVGAIAAAIDVVLEPDLGGHLGAWYMLMVVSVLSIAFGAVGGLAFGITTAFLANPRLRVPIGATVGCASGIGLMQFFHSFIVILLASLLGIMLAYKRPPKYAPTS